MNVLTLMKCGFSYMEVLNLSYHDFLHWVEVCQYFKNNEEVEKTFDKYNFRSFNREVTNKNQNKVNKQFKILDSTNRDMFRRLHG